MCLGEVAKVTEILPGRHALVSIGTRAVPVSLITLEVDVGPGDWVVVHSGFALARIDPHEAAEALALRSSAATTDAPQGDAAWGATVWIGGADDPTADDEDVDADTGVPGTVAHCCPHHLHADLVDTGVPGTFAGAGVEVRS